MREFNRDNEIVNFNLIYIVYSLEEDGKNIRILNPNDSDYIMLSSSRDIFNNITVYPITPFSLDKSSNTRFTNGNRIKLWNISNSVILELSSFESNLIAIENI